MKNIVGGKRMVCPISNGFSFFITEEERLEFLNLRLGSEICWVHITNKSDICTIWNPHSGESYNVSAKTMAKWLSTQPWFKSQVLETKATYFMSHTEKVSEVSRSCSDSKRAWGIGDPEQVEARRVISATEEYTLWSDNTPEDDRIGYIYESGELRCNIHFTGSGVGWGSITENRKTAELICVPASLAHDARSLYAHLSQSREWKPISNPAFELFKHNDETGFVVQPEFTNEY